MTKTIDDETILFYCEVDYDKKTIKVTGNPDHIEKVKDKMEEMGKAEGKKPEEVMLTVGLDTRIEEFSSNMFREFLLDRAMSKISDMLQNMNMDCNDPNCSVHGYDPAKVN